MLIIDILAYNLNRLESMQKMHFHYSNVINTSVDSLSIQISSGNLANYFAER